LRAPNDFIVAKDLGLVEIIAVEMVIEAAGAYFSPNTGRN
jgi:hypothetical protein